MRIITRLSARHLLTALALSLAPFSCGSLQAASNTWSQAGDLAQARQGSAAVLLSDGRVLITGGAAPSALASTEFFNPDGSFSAGPPMLEARTHHTGVVLQDGRVLVTGGVGENGLQTNTAEIYDPATNAWTAVAGGMTLPRAGHTASLLKDGRVLIAGGETPSGATDTLEIFSPEMNTFTAVSQAVLSSQRQQHAAAVLADGRVLIAGGSDGSHALNTADLFDPSSNSVSMRPPMSAARVNLSATTLLDGTVLIAGGNNGSADLAGAEIYDPNAGTFAPTGNLLTARSGHAAFLLPNNNEVLIVGGSSAGAALSASELFVPWSGIFVSTGALNSPRIAAAGSALKQQGQLLFAGGTDGTNPLASAEIFNFATITTDAGDYPPGTTVNISGSGWQPGETVNLTLVELPLYDTHGPYTAVADSNGNIFNNQFATDANDLNIRFYLTAKGSASQAQMTFTDGNATSVSGKVVDGSGNAISGATITCSSGCNNSPAATTTSGSDGTYIFSKDTTKLSFNGSNSVTLGLTASKSGYKSATISLQGVNNGSSLSNENFTLTLAQASTSLALQPSVGTYGGTVTLSATLSAGGSPVSGKVIAFTLNGGSAGNATTDANGIASISASVATIPAGTYNGGVTAAFAGDSSYIASNSSANLTVNRAPLTVTPEDATRQYGDANPALTGTITGVVNNDGITATYMTTAVQSSGVGRYPITAILNDPNGKLGNYTVTLNKGTLTITARAITVTADAQSKVYGTSDPALTYKVTSGSLANGDSFTGAMTRDAGENAGTYAITQGGLALTSNYVITYVGAKLTITPAPLTVTPADATRQYGDANPAFTGTITGVVNNDGITATYTTTAVQSSNVGSYAITATLSDPNNKKANYTVTPNQGTLTVTARLLTVTADAQSKVYGTSDPALTYKVTSGSLVSSDAFTGALTRDAGENVGTYAIKQGTLALNSNYALTYVGAGLTITAATLTISPDGNETKLLGSTFTAFTGKVVGLQFTDTLTVTYSSAGAPASAAVGTYDIVVAAVTFTSGSASNYNIIKNTAVNGLAVFYNSCLLYDPSRAVKSGATYPIKLYLCDVNNTDVSSPAVVLNATMLTQTSGWSGGVDDAGNANPDSNFRYDPTLGPSGGYIFNLKTSGLATGTYTISFTAGSSSSKSYGAPFGVR